MLVPPETIYPSLQRLNKLALLRQLDGKHTEYKFRYPTSVNEINNRLKEIANRTNEALYIDNPMDAIFTLHSDTAEELEEIFIELVTHYSWDSIEKAKAVTNVGINLRKPQKGSSRFSLGDTEYLTLEFNNKPGFSEKQ